MTDAVIPSTAKRVSSRRTRFFKTIFPLIWFGFLGVFAASIIAASIFSSNKPPLPMLIMPFIMAMFGYTLMRVLVFNMVDQVWDAGDRLIVINKGITRTIPLADIINVDASIFTSPPRITLSVKTNGALEKIAFSPAFQRRRDWLNMFPNSYADDLIRRIHGLPS